MNKSSQSKHRVIVISVHNDAHIPFVQKHLAEPMLVIDPQHIVDGAELSYDFSDKQVRISYRGELLDDVIGVWYRKPQPIVRRDLNVRDEYRLYVQNSLERHTVQLLSMFPNAHWVSPYYDMLMANTKSLQLVVAKQIGFNVPDTVITSSGDVARKFLNSHGQCITKPLSIALPKVDGEQKVLLTTMIDRHTTEDLSALKLAPSIFQEAVDISYEVRVIVVGTQVFAARFESVVDASVKSAQFSQVRDNRLGLYEGRVQIDAISDMPKEIKEKCIEHVKRLKMNFGALDLIVDKHNTWWFLENNPNGQWANIEHDTNLPIGAAIAEFLTTGKTSEYSHNKSRRLSHV